MSTFQVNVDPPKVLKYGENFLLFSGSGKSPGSLAFLNPVTQKVLELYVAQVSAVGGLHVQAIAAGNQALGALRLEHNVFNGSGPAKVGQTYLVGPLDYTPAGVKALGAWPIEVLPQQPRNRPQPPAHRESGIITEVHHSGQFGRITAGTRQYFVHINQLCAGAVLREGARCSFVVTQQPKGTAATDVRPV